MFITDRKANIKSLTRHFAIPHNSIPRIVETKVHSVSPQSVFFETECVRTLAEPEIAKMDFNVDPTALGTFCGDNIPIEDDPDESDIKNQQLLQTLEPKYQSAASQLSANTTLTRLVAHVLKAHTTFSF